MQIKKSWARKGLSLATAAGLTASLAMAMPIAASATETVITFTSTTRADYPAILPFGGGGGTNWSPWADADGLNAAGMSGSANWKGNATWDKNFVVQDDGSTTNGALWIHKAQAAAGSNGLTVAGVTSSESLITSSNKVITMKFKAADANVPVEAVLTDINGANAIKATATATTAGSYNTLTFNFANLTSGTFSAQRAYSLLAIVPDPDLSIAGNYHEDWGQGTVSASASKLYLVDDITFTIGAATPPPPPATNPYKLTFEDTDTRGLGAVGETYGNASEHPAGYFGGGGTGTALPPVARTGKALEFNKAAGGELYSGLVMFSATAEEKVTSSDYKTITFDYYSPDVSPLLFKLETDGDTLLKKFTAAIGWQTFTVDVSTLTGWTSSLKGKNIVLIPDFDPDNSAANTPMTGQKYYFDNVTFNGYGLATRTAANTVSGTAKSGKTLTATAGTWTGNGVTTSYQWYRCTKSASSAKSSAPSSSDKCTKVSGKTASTYKLGSSDKGKYMRVTVKATTSAGSVYSTSKSTAKVG